MPVNRSNHPENPHHHLARDTGTSGTSALSRAALEHKRRWLTQDLWRAKRDAKLYAPVAALFIGGGVFTGYGGSIIAAAIWVPLLLAACWEGRWLQDQLDELAAVSRETQGRRADLHG